MLNQYEPNVKATITFLRLLNQRVNSATVNEGLQNHPEWPSLLCISDNLNHWHIPNGAGRTDPARIDELPTPFIANTTDRGAPVAVVSRITDTMVEVYQKNFNKPTLQNKAEFIKNWNGVYLIAEPNEHSGEPDFEANKRKAFFHTLIPVAALTALLLFSFLLVWRVAGTAELMGLSAAGIYIQYVVMLAGVFVSTLLLWYEMDKNNPMLKKVCTGIARGNCSAILTGKQAQVFKGLSWSEVGFFYFAGGLLVLLFAGMAVPQVAATVAILNLLALPYTLFSVYYQWRVARQWCVLCLAVQALLLVGGINVILGGFLSSFPAFSITAAANIILLYALPVLAWYALKPFILRAQEAKNTRRQYLRIKFNTEIYEALLKKQKQVTVPVEGIGIEIGNPDAANTLIKVCNTYCGPCSKAHPKIERLLEENPDLKVKIIFTSGPPEFDPAVKPSVHLLALAEQGDPVRLQQALDDWYLAETKDYDRFAAKYPMNGELLQQAHKLDAMNDWCNEMAIASTPTIFINGYQLPDAYNIEDIQYFLLE